MMRSILLAIAAFALSACSGPGMPREVAKPAPEGTTDAADS